MQIKYFLYRKTFTAHMTYSSCTMYFDNCMFFKWSVRTKGATEKNGMTREINV